MSTKKTIQVNPELFKINGSKTRKTRPKKELTINPVISPNNLKNKLLNRIKEHKKREVKASETILKQNLRQPNQTQQEPESYSDEFHNAMDYLSELTKKNKINQAKQRMLNKTVKNNFYSSVSSNSDLSSNSNIGDISLDLPPELQTQAVIPPPKSGEVFNIHYNISDDVPYGCLKNGKKKTYREWKEASNPVLNDMIRPPTPPKERDREMNGGSERERKLDEIKTKLRKMQSEESKYKQQTIDAFKSMEKQVTTPAVLKELEEFDTNEAEEIEKALKKREESLDVKKDKKYTKTTVKRKFTLGKSDKLRRVSVLIKDKQTRKNVVNTQKELKKTSLNDVKKYLRQRGMLKVGSTCPSDILRKTFECAMLTGEVTNTNTETLLHNFMSPDH